MTTVSQQHEVPNALRAVSALASPDYVDVFTVTAPGAGDSSAEAWVRAAVEDTAGLGGQIVWRVFCGLRLDARPSREHIGGWTIAERTQRWIRLAAASWFMTVHLVAEIEKDRVTVGTFIRYDQPAGRLLWPPLAAVHRRLMPGLLRGTAARMRRYRRAA
jgi:hypothetical protein